MSTKSLDLGCGKAPKNPFNLNDVYGIDLFADNQVNIFRANLAIEAIPFETDYFDAVTAYDFIEHIPRIIFNPNQRFCFIELMNEIYRVLKPEGVFFSVTPAYPAPEAFQDPTHVNIITDKTMAMYFCYPQLHGQIYGFNGGFIFHSQKRIRWEESIHNWVDDDNGSHLMCMLVKPR